jgi:hypothetical protein
MTKREPRDTLEVATLPLQDGRQVVVPLQALVEVLQIEPGDESAELSWRGLELPVGSLDAFCGLSEPAPGCVSTIGVFKADKDSGQPFRALAFCGTAAHARIEAGQLEPEETPAEGHFVSASRMGEQVYLIPDLPALLFAHS